MLLRTCASRPRQTGIAFGIGPVCLGIVDELLIDDLIDKFRADGQDALVAMLEAAAASLPGFRNSVRKKDSARFN